MKAGTLEIEMITNVARLQKEMADMKRTVAGAMGDMADSASRADRALNAVGGGGVTRMGGTAKLAGHHVQNLVFQLNDMVVGLFSGQKPMTVFMQQGTQIGQIAMQAGVGIGGMARALLGLAASAAAAAACWGCAGRDAPARAGLAAFGADLGAGYFRGIAPPLAGPPGEFVVFFALGVAAALVGGMARMLVDPPLTS